MVHELAPSKLKEPTGHGTAVGDVLPDGQNEPALQLPEHAEVDKPAVEPYSPAAHAVHDGAPPRLKEPGAHCAAVELVLPAGHAYPAVQLPEHDGVHRPDTAPNVPPGHRPVQADIASPVLAPYVPALQFVHVPAPAKLYLPTGHMTAVELVLPDGQAYPAVQLPEQAAVGRPAVAPYSPAAHAVHVPDPDKLKAPGGHCSAVELVEPAGHAYPAVQFPSHDAFVSPREAPKLPAGQAAEHAGEVNAEALPKAPGGHSEHALAPDKL